MEIWELRFKGIEVQGMETFMKTERVEVRV